MEAARLSRTGNQKRLSCHSRRRKRGIVGGLGLLTRSLSVWAVRPMFSAIDTIAARREG